MVFKLNVEQNDFYAVTTNNKVYINCSGKTTTLSLPEDKSKVKIDASAFSKSSDLLAVVYSDKSLKIWKKSDDSWKLVKEAVVPRCLLAVCFDEEKENVYMGDKCGNVYKYKVQGGENEEKQAPIIGHISMLTDIMCTPSYVITCDTDERVRISDVTKPYVIQSFCLGHHEFVHKCVPVGGNLVTTSGDGSVKMWKMEDGTELASIRLFDGVDEDKVFADMISYSDVSGHLAVASSKSNEVQILNITENSFDKKKELKFENKVVDFCYCNDKLNVLLSTNEKLKIQVYNSNNNYELVNVVEDEFFKSINFNKSELTTDYSIWFKPTNVQNKRYIDFFKKIKLNNNARMQNENGFIDAEMV